jgi:hypothetical protein
MFLECHKSIDIKLLPSKFRAGTYVVSANIHFVHDIQKKKIVEPLLNYRAMIVAQSVHACLVGMRGPLAIQQSNVDAGITNILFSFFDELYQTVSTR